MTAIYENIRKELTEYYFEKLPQLVSALKEKVDSAMDEYAAAHPAASSYFLKSKLYDVLAENFTPVLFEDIPFYFEPGSLLPFCDGRYNRGGDHPNGWLIRRNTHLFADFDPQNYKNYRDNFEFYVQCGIYADFMHLGIPMTKLFKTGLSGILQELDEAEPKCETPAEREFIRCARSGIHAMHKMALRFSKAASEKGMTELSEMAARIPFEAPKTFHEGLCVFGFIRKALGTLEGYGFSSMGRPDALLADLYERDKARGVTDEEMLDLVSRFLLIWDCTNDRRKLFEDGISYEMENTLTLGGCDEDGNPLFNGVTKLFLTARDRLRCVYPKMMLRFSENSPEEYLQMISKPLTEGRSYSLYENDDTMIPALVSCGTELKDARNYLVGGCWDALTPDTNNKYSGEYLSLIRPFELLMTDDGGKLKNLEYDFIPFLKTKSFEELYQSYLGVIRQITCRRIALSSYGSQIWDRVSPACILSSLMQPCIPMRRDMTAGGITNSREAVYFTCFAEICDSLYAIKTLCFDEKSCTLAELFEQCKNNWPDEALRQKVLTLPSYGDGSEESAQFAGKFFDDLCAIADDVPVLCGKCRPGFNLYTEILRVGEKTGALPNGRKAGEYLTQGISPSRHLKNFSIYDMLDGMRHIDFKKTSGNASMTISLPAGKIDTEQMAALFRIFARNGLQAIQPNCIDRETLLAAKADPENHRDIIVRVCGFSAPFVCLSSKYQDEILSRSIAGV